MRLIDKAITQLGVEEVPRGSNWGTEVKKYLHCVGIDFPASWCMALVYWCVAEVCRESGMANPMVKTGGVLRQWHEIATIFKVPSDGAPMPGDIFIMDFGHGLGHTGIVIGIIDGTLHTIEGNTNDTGSREGYEVCRRTRNIHSINGFIRLNLEPTIV